MHAPTEVRTEELREARDAADTLISERFRSYLPGRMLPMLLGKFRDDVAESVGMELPPLPGAPVRSGPSSWTTSPAASSARCQVPSSYGDAVFRASWTTRSCRSCCASSGTRSSSSRPTGPESRTSSEARPGRHDSPGSLASPVRRFAIDAAVLASIHLRSGDASAGRGAAPGQCRVHARSIPGIRQVHAGSALLPELEPGRREATAPLVAPPRRQGVYQPQPTVPLRLAVGGRGRRQGQAPVPIRSVTSTRTTSSRAATVTVTTPPRTAEPLCSTEFVTSSLASKSARSMCTCDSPSTLATKARAALTFQHRRDRHALAELCRGHQGHRSSLARFRPGRAP